LALRSCSGRLKAEVGEINGAPIHAASPVGGGWGASGAGLASIVPGLKNLVLHIWQR
jgi:hypothetical protein